MPSTPSTGPRSPKPSPARWRDKASASSCSSQVNTGEEPQKAGVPPREAASFLRLCREELKLEIAGLMCIPPAEEEPAVHFAFLSKLAGDLGLAQLSMGMSADFETAVAFGATHVRVGSEIFGRRG